MPHISHQCVFCGDNLSLQHDSEQRQVRKCLSCRVTQPEQGATCEMYRRPAVLYLVDRSTLDVTTVKVNYTETPDNVLLARDKSGKGPGFILWPIRHGRMKHNVYFSRGEVMRNVEKLANRQVLIYDKLQRKAEQVAILAQEGRLPVGGEDD